MRWRLNGGVYWGGLAALAGALTALTPLWLAALTAAIAALLLIASIAPPIALHAALALAPLRALLSRAAAWPLPLDIGQLTFLALLAGWLAHSIRERRLAMPAKFRQALAPIAIFSFALLLHGALLGPSAAWLREWLKWLALLLTAGITLSFSARYGRGVVLSAILLAAAANALLGVMQFFGLVESAEHLQINLQFTRAYGSFEQPNPFAGLMGMTAPLAALAAYGYAIRARLRRRANQRNAGVWLAALAGASIALLLTMALFMSWSRGGWLGGLCAMLAALVALPKKARWSILLFCLLAALIAAIALAGVLPDPIEGRLRSATAELFRLQDVRGVDVDAGNYALVERLAHWQAALRMAEARPYLGLGLGSFEAAYVEYRLANWPEALGHAHNFYLNMLAETGIFGLAAYLAFSVVLLWRGWRARAHPDALARCLAIGVFAGWVYLCAHSLVDNLYVNHNYLILGAMLGLMLDIHHDTRRGRLEQ